MNRTTAFILWMLGNLIIAASVFIGAYLGGFRFARAHTAISTQEQPFGWEYSLSCCSKRDCAQVRDATIFEGPDGITVTLNPSDHPMIQWPVKVTIPYGDRSIKDSPDGKYHVCHSQQYTDQTGARKDGRIICLYVPPKGF